MAMRQTYAADMKLAQYLLEEGNIGGVRQILAKHQPGGGCFSNANANSLVCLISYNSEK